LKEKPPRTRRSGEGEWAVAASAPGLHQRHVARTVGGAPVVEPDVQHDHLVVQRQTLAGENALHQKVQPGALFGSRHIGEGHLVHAEDVVDGNFQLQLFLVAEEGRDEATLGDASRTVMGYTGHEPLLKCMP